MKRLMSVILAISLLTSIFAMQGFADGDSDVVIYDAAQLDTFKDRTRQSVTDEYLKAYYETGSYVHSDSSTWYEIPASTKAPYAYGRLTPDTHPTMTQMTDFYRWLTGAMPLKAGSVHSDSLQAQALDRNFEFNHFISNDSKPEDMSDELWAEGFECTHNILAGGYTPIGAITGWLNEGYSLSYKQWGTLGHRYALISPKLSDIQFGYSGSIAIGDCVAYQNEYKEPIAAFPAPGPMPNSVISARDSAWNYSLDPSKITYNSLDDIVVKVTNLNTGSSYECTKANGMISGLAFVQPDDYDTQHTAIPILTE